MELAAYRAAPGSSALYRASQALMLSARPPPPAPEPPECWHAPCWSDRGDSAPSRDNWCPPGNSPGPPTGTGLGLLSESTVPPQARSRSSVNVEGAETSGPRRPHRACKRVGIGSCRPPSRPVSVPALCERLPGRAAPLCALPCTPRVSLLTAAHNSSHGHCLHILFTHSFSQHECLSVDSVPGVEIDSKHGFRVKRS